MHCFWSGGIVEVELVLFLEACKSMKVYQKHVRLFVNARWRQPKASVRINHSSLFADTKEEFQGFAGSAGALMDILPLLRHFADEIIKPSGHIPKETESFLLLCNVCSLLQQAKALADVPTWLSDELRQAQIDHMKAFLSVYDESKIKPKHHFALHISAQIKKCRFVLDCFVHERKHRTLKQVFNTIKHSQPSSLAQVLLQRVALHWLQHDKSFSDIKLCKKKKICPASVSPLFHSLGCLSSDQISLPFGRATAGDVLSYNKTAVTLVLCCEHETVLLLLVKQWKFLRSSSSAQWWTSTSESMWIPALQVSPAGA
jgi:hypothetical protein